MNLNELAKIISYIRINAKHNCIFMNFDLYNNDRLIEHFYCEGVYNQIPQEDQAEYGQKNYHLPFFYGLSIDNRGPHDEFFMVHANTAFECAELIKMQLYTWLPFANEIKINVLHDEIKKKHFTIKINN